ncbi:isopenicillin N synthase family oxygenase [Mesorhizobium sp. M2A.F.Ca.ET.043.05.1.1]|uniref:isopenicillin N synthase family dioxygenase n=2 Tax=Mesorhizobium TaxID=68287 RepID=UPI000F7602E9|nr:2-oxoglutarate and iron-dependent oxygenase domain-containing protein [Mesorhizobium sp. M2A.F.Ca.ET.043.05.1.1]AZO18075.1 isopenicillin N synthase family oxygenase [Mesorhizobium sp. M2A.F.Ca.ET.043.05.1.1]RVB72055.1 isopenicillin N synthase family oxygenase [Mesorhizobium sp. M6A.T.Cr.TU.014.01.1.1]RWP97804.1 MAG: isopenicillin N synthase family oxygenase [Mesorhizobium sp.]RWP98724.1 MAG: isopenicillin N synthase family oxygenase [Mesorhizobium sp.]
MSMDLLTRLDDNLRAKRESFDKLPVVDIAPLLDGSNKQRVAKEIHWALSNTGFMYVKNHGIPQDYVDSVFDVSRRFFDLPMSQKMALHISKSDVALRGYIEPFGENTDPGKTKDLKECIDIGPERLMLEGPFFGPNQWPSSLPEFRELTYGYHQKMVGLAKKILQGIALSLDLSESYFESLMRNPISIQRLLHYPPQSGYISEEIIGIGAHTDYGNLTILAQDDVGGLQVMNRDGDWVEGIPIRGTFVINIGDLIQRLTNDLYLANMHRVINTSGRERYSIPFFIDADFDAIVESLPSCITDGNPLRYKPVRCGEHKFGRFAATYGHLAKA